MTFFARWISDDAMTSLRILAHAPGDNWWKQLLKEWRPSGQGQGLRLAIRENTIDFYREGWCVAHIGFTQPRSDVLPIAHMSTHIKYLDPGSQQSTLVKFLASGADAEFHHDGNALSIGQIIANIDARMAAIRAGKYKRKGLEKLGVERIIGNNAAVIDLEMAMLRDEEIAQKYAVNGKMGGAPRIDLLSLEPSQAGANIVFWEAKTLDDPRLRAEVVGNVEVIKQLNAYQEYLSNRDRCADIVKAYMATCRRLAELNDLRPNKGKLDRLILEVAAGKIHLDVNLQPRLIIFGEKNGKSAYEDKYWKPHAERIVKEGIWATYVSDPTDIDLASEAKPIAG